MEIKKTAVLGAGTMGPTVTQVYAGGGYDVVMYTRRAETLESAKKILNMNLNTFVEEGVITAGQKTEALSHVTYTLDLAEAAEGADYIEESIVEDPDAKRAIYAEIDALAKAEAIIASNTSCRSAAKKIPSSPTL